MPGYLAGALYAELALVQPTGGGRRQATLVPRELEEYLPRRLLVAQSVLAALVAASAVAASARRFAADARRLGAGIDDAISALRVAYVSEV